MMTHKSLGQIAYEARYQTNDPELWESEVSGSKAEWERAAQAVADELRKGEWICTRCGIRQESKHESHGDF